MITKIYLEDGIEDVDYLIKKCESWLDNIIVVYDKYLNMIAVDSDCDIRHRISELHDIVGYEVEE